MMESFDHDPGRARPASGTPDAADGAATLAGDRQLGAHAPALLAAEHWSLLAHRSMIWNEAQSRATLVRINTEEFQLVLAMNPAGPALSTPRRGTRPNPLSGSPAPLRKAMEWFAGRVPWPR